MTEGNDSVMPSLGRFNFRRGHPLLMMVMLFTSVTVFAQKGDLSSADDDGWETVTEKVSDEKLKKINSDYLVRVKPIFKTKCLDCPNESYLLAENL